jgi:phage terminase small subunit
MQKREEKLEKFIEHYLLFKNAKQAAIAAGYSAKTAESAGSRLLSDVKVQAALAKQKAERAKSMKTGREELEDELRHIAFGDMADLASWGPGGVVFKNSDDVAAAVRRTVNEISSADTQHGTNFKLKKVDKLTAIKMLAQMAGILDPDQAETEIKIRVLRG